MGIKKWLFSVGLLFFIPALSMMRVEPFEERGQEKATIDRALSVSGDLELEVSFSGGREACLRISRGDKLDEKVGKLDFFYERTGYVVRKIMIEDDFILGGDVSLKGKEVVLASYSGGYVLCTVQVSGYEEEAREAYIFLDEQSCLKNIRFTETVNFVFSCHIPSNKIILSNVQFQEQAVNLFSSSSEEGDLSYSYLTNVLLMPVPDSEGWYYFNFPVVVKKKNKAQMLWENLEKIEAYSSGTNAIFHNCR